MYDEVLDQRPGNAICFNQHKCIQTATQGKDFKGKKNNYRVALQNISFGVDQQTEVMDPISKLHAQSLTFPVSKHMHAFLEQGENSQTLDTEDTASFSEDEQPPPIPERRYLKQNDTPCIPNLYIGQQGVTTLQDLLILKRSQMASPASDRICQSRRQCKPEYEVTQSDTQCQDKEQPIVTENESKQMTSPASDRICQSRRQRKPEYEVTQSDAQRQDKEQPIVTENESKQMTSPASDRVYQPLLPRRQRKPEYEVTRSDAKCQDDEQSIAAESNSKQTKGPASDRVYQQLLPRRQCKPEYEVTRSDAKCQDNEQLITVESNSKQMTSPVTDRIYQPLLLRTAQQENAEYQSLHFKKSQSDAKCQDKEQPIVAENKSKQMTSSASDRIYQPLLPRRQRKPEYEVTRSDAKCQDDEQPIAAENKSKQMTSPVSDHTYQPLLPRRQRKPEYEVTQSDAKCQDDEQSIAAESNSKQTKGPASDRMIYQSPLIRSKRKPAKCQDREQPIAAENKSKQMNSPASDRIYQPLLPRRTAQQNAEYQSLHFKN